jgi:hypothetical protein
MYYKITDGSFTYEDADGNEQTVKGSLAIIAPSDNDVLTRGDTHLGNVVFVTASDEPDDIADDAPAPRKVPGKSKSK